MDGDENFNDVSLGDTVVVTMDKKLCEEINNIVDNCIVYYSFSRKLRFSSKRPYACFSTRTNVSSSS